MNDIATHKSNSDIVNMIVLCARRNLQYKNISCYNV